MNSSSGNTRITSKKYSKPSSHTYKSVPKGKCSNTLKLPDLGQSKEKKSNKDSREVCKLESNHKMIYLENYFKHCFIQTWARLSTEMSKYILPRSLLILHGDPNFSLTSSAAVCSKPVGTVAPIVTWRCSDSLLRPLSVTCIDLWFSWRFTSRSWLVASWTSDILAVLPRSWI